MELLTFGQAIAAVKEGKLISRKGWNGKDMFVFLRPEDTLTVQQVDQVKSLPMAVKTYFYLKTSVPFQLSTDTVKFSSYLCLKSADNTIFNGWIASQTDILSDDWYILE